MVFQPAMVGDVPAIAVAAAGAVGSLVTTIVGFIATRRSLKQEPRSRRVLLQVDDRTAKLSGRSDAEIEGTLRELLAGDPETPQKDE